MSHAHFLLPACSGSAATAAVASAANPNKRKVEPYGRAYQATKHAAPKLSSAEEETAAAASSNVLQLRDVKYDRYKKFDIELNDYYALLGLEEKMFDSTKEEITEAYRTLCKVIHPDKALPEDRVKAEERYKALQVGWETLTDAARRRGYDSSLEFDDAIPKEKEGSSEKTFFSVYGPVFDSNARFSVNRPVPKLGDINTPDADVQDFYDFWNSFQSWREFPELNKNTLESASCREQKREYERENAKAQAGKKKEELARVRKLAEMAYKKDPRIQRIIAKRDEAKNAAKKKKEDEAREKEEAALRKAFEEEQRKERLKLQEAKDKEDKKNFKEVQKKTRAAFGKASKAAGLDDEKTDILRAALELEQLQEIVAEFTKDPKSALAIQMWNSYIDRIQSEEAKRKAMSADQLAADKAEQKKLEEAREAASAKPWTHDEEQILTKAVTKYPPGTLLRWETITDMVNSITSRNIKDVIRKAKMMESGDLGSQHVDDNAAYQLYLAKMGKGPAPASSSSSSSAPAASATFSVEEQALFEKALKAVNKDAKDRWTQIAAQVKTKTAEQCEARFNQIKEDIKKNKK